MGRTPLYYESGKARVVILRRHTLGTSLGAEGPMTGFVASHAQRKQRPRSLSVTDSRQKAVRAAHCPDGQVPSTTYFLASSIRLNGVSVARRNLVKPPSANTRASRTSPAWAPSPRPTSCDREFGVQTMVDAA